MDGKVLSTNRFDWAPLYHDFAKAILPFRNNQPALIEGLKEAFHKAGIKIPTLDDDGTIEHMDPFTMLGLFNKSGMKDNKRLQIISALADVFHVDAPMPTRFDGIPVLYPLGATFYPFSEKTNESLFDMLWDLLETALQYAGNKDTSLLPKLKDLITRAIEIKYNGNSKITMALYWIAPETFINLDSRNEWYIYESGKVPMESVFSLPKINGENLTGDMYFAILEGVQKLLPDLGFNGFPELSYEAWRYSEEVNAQEKEQKAQEKTQGAVGTGLGDTNVRTKQYWLYSPGEGASKWDEFYHAGVIGIGWFEIGDLKQYDTREAIRQAMKHAYGEEYNYKMNSLAAWEFSHSIQPGDIIYAKRGIYQIVGRAIVTSTYEYNPSFDAEYPHLLHVEWTHCGEWPHPGKAATKTLTRITEYTDYVNHLETLLSGEENNEEPEIEATYPPYTKEKFLNEVYMDEADLTTLTGLLKKKKNIILQGAPGVGKTYAAKRIAYALMGEKNQDRVMMVQFHQSYSYEDFIEGFRPGGESNNQFVVKKGSFYRFCKKAGDDLENDYYFIIDEINRGNMSRIFGELFMLIEADKRGNALQLLYSDEKFTVPGNVYIIGTMNTADRSLALLDYALRRRFAFYDMKPGFESKGFREYQELLNNAKFTKLISQIKVLNEAIAKDDSLGEGFCIGHSYFCDLKEITDNDLHDIVEYEIAPLLREYWYDEKSKAENAIASLKDAIR